ncbi:hypothetical protein Esti_000716 [Eimeria stiedai]
MKSSTLARRRQTLASAPQTACSSSGSNNNSRRVWCSAGESLPSLLPSTNNDSNKCSSTNSNSSSSSNSSSNSSSSSSRMEDLEAEGESVPDLLLGVSSHCMQLLSLPLLLPHAALLPDRGSVVGAPEEPLPGGPNQPAQGAPFVAAAVTPVGSNSSIVAAALQHKPTILYFNLAKDTPVYRQSTPSILRCLVSDTSGSFLFGGDDSGVLTAWQLSGCLLQQPAAAAPAAAAETQQHKLSPLLCSWQAHDSSVCQLYVHQSLLISAGRDGSLKAFQLAHVLSPVSGGNERAASAAGSSCPPHSSSSSSRPRPCRRWQGHTDAVRCCCFLEGPALHRAAAPWLLVSAAADRTVRVFGPESDECVESFRLPSEPLCMCLYTRGPTPFAFVGAADNNIYILKVAVAAGSSSSSSEAGRRGGEGGGVLLREAWVTPPCPISSSSSSSRAAVLQGHCAAVRGCVCLGDGRLVTAASDGLRVWSVSTKATVSRILPRPGLALPLEGLQLLPLQEPEARRVLAPLGLLRQHSSSSTESAAAATAVCLLQPHLEQQQLQQAALLQQDAVAAAAHTLSLFSADPRRFKQHAKNMQLYGQRNEESPRCMQQLLKLSQGAAETLQEAVLRFLAPSVEAVAAKREAAAAAAAAAVAAVDAKGVDAAELSPVSSDDERSAAAVRGTSKRKLRA